MKWFLKRGWMYLAMIAVSVAPDPRDRMSVAACQYLFDWATTVYNTAPLPAFPAAAK